jgi:hypothetical protein
MLFMLFTTCYLAQGLVSQAVHATTQGLSARLVNSLMKRRQVELQFLPAADDPEDHLGPTGLSPHEHLMNAYNLLLDKLFEGPESAHYVCVMAWNLYHGVNNKHTEFEKLVLKPGHSSGNYNKKLRTALKLDLKDTYPVESPQQGRAESVRTVEQYPVLLPHEQ